MDIQHDYYSDGRCSDFNVIPSAETAALLQKQQLLYKTMANNLTILIRVDANDKPYIHFDRSKKLTFFMILREGFFYNFTNVDYKPSERRCYYFSNDNQNEINTAHYLSSKIAVYNAANDYTPGSLASSSSNDIYESIKPNSAAEPHALTDLSFWMKREKLQYVNSGDLLDVSSSVYYFKSIAAKIFSAQVFGLNSSASAYDRPVTEKLDLTYSELQTLVPIRLEKLPPGQYRIAVNGQNKQVYIDDNAINKKVFGIIELINNLPPANSFSLFDAASLPKGLKFIIRFTNRAVYWKYISRTDDVTAITDSRPAPEKYTFLPEASRQFISNKLIPLREKPLTTLTAETASSGNVSPIANPGREKMASIIKDNDTYFCSEQHLNY